MAKNFMEEIRFLQIIEARLAFSETSQQEIAYWRANQRNDQNQSMPVQVVLASLLFPLALYLFLVAEELGLAVDLALSISPFKYASQARLVD